MSLWLCQALPTLYHRLGEGSLRLSPKTPILQGQPFGISLLSLADSGAAPDLCLSPAGQSFQPQQPDPEWSPGWGLSRHQTDLV